MSVIRIKQKQCAVFQEAKVLMLMFRCYGGPKSLDEAQTCRNIKINPRIHKKSINEEVEVEEAEVVIAPRALGDQIQDAIEDVGRASQ